MDDEIDRQLLLDFCEKPFHRVVLGEPPRRIIQRVDPFTARQTFDVDINGVVSSFTDLDEAIAAYNADLKIDVREAASRVVQLIVPIASKDNTKRRENIQITWKITWPDLRVVFVVWEGAFGYNEFATVEEAVAFYNAL